MAQNLLKISYNTYLTRQITHNLLYSSVTFLKTDIKITYFILFFIDYLTLKL